MGCKDLKGLSNQRSSSEMVLSVEVRLQLYKALLEIQYYWRIVRRTALSSQYDNQERPYLVRLM